MKKAFLICITMFLVCAKKAAGMVDPSRVFTDARVIALARSVAKGDVVEVQRQIASGVDVKVKGAKGFTLTQFALYAEDHGDEVLRLLLKAGADPISTLENGHDVPHYAASRENAKPDFLAVLLDAGVSPNMIGGGQGNSLLDAAVSARNRAIISLLLARGANVNLSDSFTGTALHTAMIMPDYQIATLLLDHGANPHLKDSQNPAIRANIARHTTAELYCDRLSGHRPNPSPEQAAEFEAMKAAFGVWQRFGTKWAILRVAKLLRFGHHVNHSVSLSLSACLKLICAGILARSLHLLDSCWRDATVRGGRITLILLALGACHKPNGPFCTESLPYPKNWRSPLQGSKQEPCAGRRRSTSSLRKTVRSSSI